MKNNRKLLAISILFYASSAMAEITIDPKAYHEQRQAEKKARLSAPKPAIAPANISQPQAIPDTKNAAIKQFQYHPLVPGKKEAGITTHDSSSMSDPQQQPTYLEPQAWEGKGSLESKIENSLETISNTEMDATAEEMEIK